MSRWLRWLWNPLPWIILGLIALAFLIWLVGPEVAIGRHRPLYSETARIVVIAVLVLLLFLRFGWARLRMAYTNSQLLEHLRSRRERGAGDAEQAALAERFNTAVETLKQARFDNGGRGSVLQRLSRQYLYQLPWYIFIGAPGSGKTTALLNSDLEFPLAGSLGKGAVKGVAGTQRCDWWFTNDAVLIDTAGRYSTQDSNQQADSAEWNGFLGLLKKFRPRQPINGVILTVSVADLLDSGSQELARHAQALRSRLQELNGRLGITFPVYVLVTKLDLLAGFNQYFASLSRQERSQVWGATLPLPEQDGAPTDLGARLAEEYKLLYHQLRQGLPTRLAEGRTLEDNAQAYLLPQEFAVLEEPLKRFILDVFNTSKFEHPVLLRGLYFTSGTQEGTVLDRVMGAIKRKLGLSEVPVASQSEGGGRGYFLKGLMQDVIFREVALAGRNLVWERRRRWLQGFGYAALAILMVGGSLGLWRSFELNNSYLAEIARKLPFVDMKGQTIQARAGDILDLLPRLDGLRDLPKSEDFDIGDPPWKYRLGLYQGRTVQESGDLLYQHGLRGMLLPQASKYIEQRLLLGEMDGQYTYEALKAYLMLYDPQRYDGGFLRDWLYTNLRRELPEGFTEAQSASLEQHLQRLFDREAVRSPYPIDPVLVERTRVRLAQLPLVDRAYQRVRRLLLAESPANAFTIVSAGGPEASQTMQRKSGLPLTEGIPMLFTYDGYHDLFNSRYQVELATLQKEDIWVLNMKPRAQDMLPDHQARLARQVKVLYLNEYVKVWDTYLNDITAVQLNSLMQAAQVSRSLSDLNSPLVRFIRNASKETTLLRPVNKRVESLVARAGSGITSTRERLEQLVGRVDPRQPQRKPRSAPDRPERIVDDHFMALRMMTIEPAPGQPTPLESVRQLLNELYVYLVSAESALRSGAQPPTSDIVPRLQANAGRMPNGVRTVLTSLSTATSTQTRALEHRNIRQNMSGSIGSYCRQTIQGRYPFARNARQEVVAGDFTRLFAPNGLFDNFFQSNLAGKVNMSTRPWSFNPGLAGYAGDLRAFEQAGVLRSVFFANGGTLSMGIQLRVLSMDPEISRFSLDAGGQKLEYMHGPERPVAMTWPTTHGDNQVRLQIGTRDGRTTTLNQQGLWALHRIFDQAVIQPGRSPEVFVARYTLGGRPVVLEVRANSVHNPFRLSAMRNFTCPGDRFTAGGDA